LVLSKFRGGEISEAGVAYTHFRSAISQQPSYETILPISPKQSTGDGMASERQPSVDYLIEPNREELIETVLQSYVESAIFHALLESEASEQAARMTAMDSATNNAADMIDRLSLEMNRARQAAITTELMDIVGGAEALR
jgi:F-type H+-transporting ATPase subunit gamma